MRAEREFQGKSFSIFPLMANVSTYPAAFPSPRWSAIGIGWRVAMSVDALRFRRGARGLLPSAFVHRIEKVVQRRTEKQMRRADARPHVTFMEDKQSLGDWPIGEFPHDSMRFLISSINPNLFIVTRWITSDEPTAFHFDDPSHYSVTHLGNEMFWHETNLLRDGLDGGGGHYLASAKCRLPWQRRHSHFTDNGCV